MLGILLSVCSENKVADQLHGYRAANLLHAKSRFSHDTAYFVHCYWPTFAFIIRKQPFHLCVNKDAVQLLGNNAADQACVFAT